MARSIKKVLAPIVSRLSEPDPFAYLMGDKKDLIDFVFERFRPKSFADLGGVWNVDGGYTFYALEKFAIEKAFLVDTDFTDDVLQRAKLYPVLKVVHGNFGKRETIWKVR